MEYKIFLRIITRNTACETEHEVRLRTVMKRGNFLCSLHVFHERGFILHSHFSIYFLSPLRMIHSMESKNAKLYNPQHFFFLISAMAFATEFD